MIEIRHLRKSFGSLDVLKDVNTVIGTGEVVSLIGPSGAGKSTLLRCLNRLERADAGEILVDGCNILAPSTDVTALRRDLGMVFQQFNLFPHLTVLENITTSPRQLRGLSYAAAEKEAQDLLTRVGLAEKAYALPSELSGGQQQRVALARALAMHPKVLLLDEPTSALDPANADEVLRAIADLAQTGLTLVVVTHEMRLARSISSRILYLDEGVIYEEGTPERLFSRPARPKTAAFLQTFTETATGG